MKWIDRGLSVVMLIGACGHTYGSLTFFHDQPQTRFWALNGTLAILLVAAINLLRTSRPDDRGLAWLAAAASLAWLAVSLGFGMLIGNILDPRVILFAVAALGLTFFSLRTAMAR